MLPRLLRAHFLPVAASALVPLTLFCFVAWQDRLVLLRDADADVARGADSVREHALKVLQTDALVIALIDQQIRSMSWDDIAASRSLHDYLAKLVQQNPELEGAFVADPSGTVRNSSRFFPALSASVASRDFFIAAQKGAGLAFGDRIDDDGAPNESIEPHFHVAARRTGADGHFDGLIALSLSSAYFPKVWQQSWHNPPNVLTVLVNPDLNIVARVPPGPLKVAPGGKFATAVREESDSGAFRTVSTVDGIDRLIAYRRIEPYAAYVIFGISFDSVLRAWYQHLLVYGCIFGLAALALSAVSLIAARHIEGESIAVRELAAETEKRHETEKQLFEAEKLEAMGKVAGGFAHDFGNLLMALQMNLECMHVTADSEESLRMAKAEIERGTEAIRALMIFARNGSLETQITDPQALLEQMSALLRQAIGSHSTLEISIEQGLWPIEINANQLQLALLNLAVNARDAMPNGGKLRVAARNASFLAEAPDGLTGDFVEISVSDTGTGIAPEIATKVFEPFFTTKDAGKGTGLGLSQVYGFAKGCEGTATVTSAVGQGTTVTIYIPRAQLLMSPQNLSPSGNVLTSPTIQKVSS